MRLMQIQDSRGRFVAARDDNGQLYRLRDFASVFALARQVADSEQSLSAVIAEARGDLLVEEHLLATDGKILSPIDHPEPACMIISGTGLTHLGSAQTRDSMHAQEDTPQTDSMKMFRLGVEGGKPPAHQFWGAQPEWFYKGDGRNIVAPGGDLLRPVYALDGGEEPELVGIYIINSDGQPCRIGFTLGNEYSDHIMEKQNYLWLAHSKLRQCALGAELLLGDLPAEIRGTSAVRRNGEIIWQKEFLSGEKYMCHSIANLERHHFKYDTFCVPGTVHVHFFGTATLSFVDGIKTQDGDEFVIASPLFGQPLINRLRLQAAPIHRDIKVL